MTKRSVIPNDISCPLCGELQLHDFFDEIVQSNWEGWEGPRTKVRCFAPKCRFASYRTLTQQEIDTYLNSIID